MELKVRITPKFIGYLLVLIISIVPAVFVNTTAGYLPFFALFLAGILSFVQLMVLRNRITYQIASGQETLVRGDDVPFSVEITNTSILPVVHMRAEFYIANSRGKDSHVYPLLITLSPKETRSFSLDANFPHIGVYEAGFKRMILFDLFDNFRATGETEDTSGIDIKPNVYEMSELPVSTTEVSESSRAAAVSPLSGMDYSGVREYAYGDPIKTVQWKLSAHAGNMMTKVMESYTNSGVCIMMDFHIPNFYEENVKLDLVDGIVETAASVGAYARKNGLDYLLMYTEEDESFKKCTPSSFHDLRKWVEDFQVLSSDPRESADFISQSSKGVDQQSNIVLCTSDLSDRAIAAIIRLKQAKKNIAVYYFIPDDVYDVQRQELTAPLKKLQRSQIPVITASNAKGMVIPS